MGGQTYAVPFSDANSVLNAELWDPTTGKFTVMAPEAEPRNYHSVGILLPDGRVFSGGGGLCGTCSTNHPDGQIFTPPYLLTPTARSAPARPSRPPRPGGHRTDDHGHHRRSGVQFSMVRYGESTHSVDNDQRRMPLSIVSSSGNTYQLAIPSDPGIALPGPVHAVCPGRQRHAECLHHHLDHQRRHPAAFQPLRPGGLRGRTRRLLAAQRDGGATAADLSGNGDTANYLGGGFTYGVPSPVEGAGGQGVTLNGSTSQIVASQPITNPTDYSEEMWFKTTTTTGGLLMGFGTSASGTTSASRDRMVCMANNGQLYFGVYPGTAITHPSPLSYNDGKWHHVVATQGPDGMHLYVDGQQVASNTTTGAQSYLGYWRVGAENLAGWSNSPTSNYFAGSVSDVAFYNSELSSRQVLAHFQAAGTSAARLSDQLGLFGHRGSAARRPADADRLHLVGQWRRRRHLGDGRLLPLRRPDPGRRRYGDRPCDRPGQHQRRGPRPASCSGPPPTRARRTTRPSSRPATGWPSSGGRPRGAPPHRCRHPERYPPTCESPAIRPGAPSPTPPTRQPTARRGRQCPVRLRRSPASPAPSWPDLAVTSHNQGTSSTVGFDTVSVTTTEYPPPGIGCPTGWTCSDIGVRCPPASRR